MAGSGHQVDHPRKEEHSHQQQGEDHPGPAETLAGSRAAGPDQNERNNADETHGEELAQVDGSVPPDPGYPGVEPDQVANRPSQLSMDGDLVLDPHHEEQHSKCSDRSPGGSARGVDQRRTDCDGFG